MNFLRSLVLRWLIFVGVLTTSFSSDAADTEHPVSDAMGQQADIIKKMKAMFPQVEAHVVWMPCREVNSYYIPQFKTILLCTEFPEERPLAAVAVAAHEMAHAITDQLTDTGDEQDADELGALACIKFGYREELLDLAVYFAEQDPRHQPGDLHPGYGYRAWELACIEDGSEPNGSDECKLLYRGLVVRWSYRLSRP